MYLFVSKLSKNKYVGTLSAVLYMTMPYHLNDMYIRNSIGETLSFIFIPLVFLGMYKIFQKEKGVKILCIGAIRINLNTYSNDSFNSDDGWNLSMYKYCKIKR